MDLPSQVHVEEDEEGEAAAAQEAEAERKRSPSPASTHSHMSNNKMVEMESKKPHYQALQQSDKVKVQAKLMEKISAKTEVEEITVFPVGNEVPLYGVHSEEHNELERVSLIFRLKENCPKKNCPHTLPNAT